MLGKHTSDLLWKDEHPRELPCALRMLIALRLRDSSVDRRNSTGPFRQSNHNLLGGLETSRYSRTGEIDQGPRRVLFGSPYRLRCRSHIIPLICRPSESRIDEHALPAEILEHCHGIGSCYLESTEVREGGELEARPQQRRSRS
jgi:hypothetical protein